MNGINENQSFLKILSKTWGRDSHGLYDYESTQVKVNTMIVNKNCMFIRKRNDVKDVHESYELDNDEKVLAYVKNELNKYYLINPINFQMQATEDNINDLQNKLWYIIKQEDTSNSVNNSNQAYSNDPYDIKINDIIKLGRVKYVVTELRLNNKNIEKDNKNSVFNLICDYNKNINLNPEILCKICLSNHEDDENPLINLCKCTGSISCLHFLCLKKWMETKLNIKENEKKTVTSYNMKSFNCEICKTPYPLRFKSDNINFDIIEYKRPTDKNYIILESLNQLKDNNNYKSIQVITLEEGVKIIMGRGHDTDVRINDISVSRTHAMITLTDNKIFIKDLKSKFGTLVLIKGLYEIGEKTVCLQIGRTYNECSIMSLKELQKLKNDIPLGVSDKNKLKQLFQVEKPKDKYSNNMVVDNNSPDRANQGKPISKNRK